MDSGMRRIARWIRPALFGAAVLLGGCATLFTLDEDGVYGGTKADAYFIAGAVMAPFTRSYGMGEWDSLFYIVGPLALMDLPLSIVADTVVVPYKLAVGPRVHPRLRIVDPLYGRRVRQGETVTVSVRVVPEVDVGPVLISMETGGGWEMIEDPSPPYSAAFTISPYTVGPLLIHVSARDLEVGVDDTKVTAIAAGPTEGTSIDSD